MLVLQAWRSWRGSTGVAVLAAGALTVGIGAASAIYTVVNAVMLRPLPYAHGERFVAIFGGSDTDPEHFSSLSSNDARTYSAATQAFDAFGWFRASGKNLTFAGEPHHVQGVSVTTPLIQQLGVTPLHGQWFTDETGVVLSRSLWQRLGGDPAIVGKPLTLDGRSYTVTGVMPETFRLPVADIGGTGTRTDVWLALDPAENAGAAYFAYARRKPGVSIDAAAADARRVAAVMAKADPIGHPAYTARLFDLRTVAINEIRPTLLLLFAASGFLFLITCANAAGLLLARSVERTRDTATRVSLGAGRRHLATLYFLENVPVAFAGAVGGILASVTLTPAIVSLASDYIPRAEEVALDWTVLGFALTAGFLATVLSGVVPLWQALRIAPADALGDGARTTAGCAQPPHLAVAGRGGDRTGVRAARRQRRALAALAAVVADGTRFRPGRNPDVHRQPSRADSGRWTPSERRRSVRSSRPFRSFPASPASRLRTTCRSTVAASRRPSSRMGSRWNGVRIRGRA